MPAVAGDDHERAWGVAGTGLLPCAEAGFDCGAASDVTGRGVTDSEADEGRGEADPGDVRDAGEGDGGEARAVWGVAGGGARRLSAGGGAGVLGGSEDLPAA